MASSVSSYHLTDGSETSHQTQSSRVPACKSSGSGFNRPLDWSNGSRQPLLPSDSSGGLPNGRGSQENLGSRDVESQSRDTKSDSASMRREVRIDARIISDATIGLSDGLTVPFALTAGLSALGNTKVVIYGGFSELIAGAISMGLGGYLGAKSEAASYEAIREETRQLIVSDPRRVQADITEIFEPYDVPSEMLDSLTQHLIKSPHLVDFVMKFQHCQEEPAASRAVTSASTIAAGYFLGGLLPLIPYFFVRAVFQGLYISIVVMVIALFTFGYVKTCVVVGWHGRGNMRRGFYGGVQMVIVGSMAAGAAMGLVRLFNSEDTV